MVTIIFSLVTLLASFALMTLGFAWALIVESWHDAVGALFIFVAGLGLGWMAFMP